jgi:hypothetical protein
MLIIPETLKLQKIKKIFLNPLPERNKNYLDLSIQSGLLPSALTHSSLRNTPGHYAIVKRIQEARLLSCTSLTEAANVLHTDKGTTYKCAHGYTNIYERLFSGIVQQAMPSISILEIGLNRDGAYDVPSLKLWRHFFGKSANITGFDINPEFIRYCHLGFNIHIGDQGDPRSYGVLTYHPYDVIIDDGSHASSDQQISFKTLWPCIKPGGLYIIEDLHWQPYEEKRIKSVDLLKDWSGGRRTTSDILENDFLRQLEATMDSITFYPSISNIWPKEKLAYALACIKKKKL